MPTVLPRQPGHTAARGLLAALILLHAAAPPRALAEAAPADDAAAEWTDVDSTAVTTYLGLAESRQDRGDLDAALAGTEKALARQPTSRSAHLKRAELLYLIGRRDGSEAQVAEARALLAQGLDPETPGPGALYVQALMDLEEGRAAEARETLSALAEREATWAEAWRLLARALLREGDVDGADRALAQALELDANAKRALADRANLRLVMADFRAAALEAGGLLRSREDDALRRTLGEALARLGRFKDAVAALEAIPATRRSVADWRALAAAQRRTGALDASAASLADAQALAPGDTAVLADLVALDLAAGRPEAALERAAAAAAAEPDDAAPARLQGQALAALDRDAEAGVELRRALELAPDDVETYTAISIALSGASSAESVRKRALAWELSPAAANFFAGNHELLQGDPRAAARFFERALAEQPDLALAQGGLAYALALEGRDLDRALALARSAQARLPDDPSTADTLGFVLLEKGAAEQAVRALRRALRLTEPGAPGNAEILYHLAKAEAAVGDHHAALQHSDAALARVSPHDPPDWAPDAVELRRAAHQNRP